MNIEKQLMVQSHVCRQLGTGAMGAKKWICTKKEVHSLRRLNTERVKRSLFTSIKHRMLKWLRQLQHLSSKQNIESIDNQLFIK